MDSNRFKILPVFKPEIYTPHGGSAGILSAYDINNNPVGKIDFRFFPDFNEARIKELNVSDDYRYRHGIQRGQGIGKELLATAENIISIYCNEITVNSSIEAEEFYKRQGYEYGKAGMYYKTLPNSGLKFNLTGVFPLFYVDERIEEAAWDLIVRIFPNKSGANATIKLLANAVNHYKKPAWIYCVNGELAGFIQGDGAEIELLYTHPDFRAGYSVGTSLVLAFENYLRCADGIGEMSVESLPDACDFYEKIMKFQKHKYKYNYFTKTL